MRVSWVSGFPGDKDAGIAKSQVQSREKKGVKKKKLRVGGTMVEDLAR